MLHLARATNVMSRQSRVALVLCFDDNCGKQFFRTVTGNVHGMHSFCESLFWENMRIWTRGLVATRLIAVDLLRSVECFGSCFQLYYDGKTRDMM